MGLVIQPIIGVMSDRTWNRFGRRIPYLFVGALVAVIVMCLLPNAGSLHLAVGAAMVFGLISLMLLDTSINVAMQPFKMLVGDMVNERQKGFAYSIQSFLCNAGSLVGYLCPILFAAIGIANVAPKGMVPDTVIYSFYVGAVILILCVVYTVFAVKEMNPKEYAEFHGVKPVEKDEERVNLFKLLVNAPKVFWTVGLVQFFCWAAFMYMWTYTNGAIADTVWGTTETSSPAYQEAGNWVGVLFAVQAVGSVIWALIIPRFKSHRVAYVVSLVIGALGFISTAFIDNQYVLFVPYFMVGCAWAAMLSLPFTLLTNALSGNHLGSYLGLFNGTICVPQIAAALAGGVLLKLVGGWQVNMLVVAGVFLILGAAAVLLIKDTRAK